MKEKNYWEQFMQSGRIEDYLYFREQCDRVGQTEAMKNVTEGENLHAGFCCSDGNGAKNGGYW